MAKKEKVTVKCYDCRLAYLMQSAPVNPVVSKCGVNGERIVASTPHPCENFTKRNGKIVINPMIYLK